LKWFRFDKFSKGLITKPSLSFSKKYQ